MKDVNMTEGNLIKKIFLFAIPVMLSSILQLLFNAVDMIVIGKFAGDDSLAAVGSCASLIHLCVNMFIGVSIGANVLVSQAVGNNDYEKAQRASHTAIVFSLIAGIILSIIGIVLARPLLIAMDTTAEVLDKAVVYIRIYFAGSLFNMLYNFGAAILKSVGETKRPLYYLTIAGIANALLNLLFVLVFHMDVAGVAIATIVSQAISAILVFISLLKRDGYVGIKLNKLRIHGRELGQMTLIGLPAGIQGCLISFSNVFIQKAVNSFENLILVSGNTASQNIEGFVWTSMNSFYQASIAFTGQNHGAGKMKNCRNVLFICLGFVIITGMIMGGGAYLLREPLLSLYTSPEGVKYGMIRITYVALPYFLCGMMDVVVGSLRGLGKSSVPMVVSILGMVGFRILWISTVFQSNHTLEMLYISYPISWILTGIVQYISFFIVYKMKKKQFELKIEA